MFGSKPAARGFGLLAILSLLAACGSEPVGTVIGAGIAAPITEPQPGPEDLATCQGAPYVRLIGQDATVLERELILRQVRIIRPNRPIASDFRAMRLNFTVNELNRIARVSCG